MRDALALEVRAAHAGRQLARAARHCAGAPGSVERRLSRLRAPDRALAQVARAALALGLIDAGEVGCRSDAGVRRRSARPSGNGGIPAPSICSAACESVVTRSS
jgi:hypothetical protein